MDVPHRIGTTNQNGDGIVGTSASPNPAHPPRRTLHTG
jgi:hypothetical protein